VSERMPLASRFRGFMPVVIDVECGGFNPNTDALLEIAAVLIELQPDGRLAPGESWRFHIQPFEGAKFEAASLAVTGIDPFHPLRPAIAEKEALTKLFKEIRRAMKENECTRAILVGHNASFDLGFLNAAVIGVSFFYSICYLPFVPLGILTVVILVGVLLLSPFLSLIAAISMRQQLRRIAATTPPTTFALRTTGLLVALGFTFGAVVLIYALRLP